VTDRTGLMNAFDPNFCVPLRSEPHAVCDANVTQKVTLDFKYIGTLTRKLYTNMDLNSPNFLFNGLKEAFDSAKGAASLNCSTGCSRDLPSQVSLTHAGCPLLVPDTWRHHSVRPSRIRQHNGRPDNGAMALRAYNGTRSNLATATMWGSPPRSIR
jgi:hypothetical protein